VVDIVKLMLKLVRGFGFPRILGDGVGTNDGCESDSSARARAIWAY
jgi:hypothetical protein